MQLPYSSDASQSLSALSCEVTAGAVLELATVRPCLHDLALAGFRDHDDPRRVFRELWHVAYAYALFAVLTVVDFCSYQYVAASHWLQARLERGVRLRPPSQFLY